MTPLLRVAAGLAMVTAAVSGCGGAGNPVTTTPGQTVVTAPTATESISRDARAVFDREIDRYGPPGGIALIDWGVTGVAFVSGFADVDGSQMFETSRFRIASITKPIVAGLVLDSVSRGELSLDDDVADLLPGTIDSEPPVTVRMILDHTSGVFDEGNEGDIREDIGLLTDPQLQEEAAELESRYLSGERVVARDELLVALAETHERYFDPGQGYHYSNINYQLAGMVLERVTGVTLSELLRARIVEPLGLEHTTIAPADLTTPDMHGYGIGADGTSLVDLTDDLVAFGNGANGGIISAADELLTIMQAIRSGRIVDGPLLAEMTEPTLLSESSYGLGLAVYHLSCGTLYGHGGGVNGTASIAMVTANGEAGVVIVFNLRRAEDPRLPAIADSLLCPGLRALDD